MKCLKKTRNTSWITEEPLDPKSNPVYNLIIQTTLEEPLKKTFLETLEGPLRNPRKSRDCWESPEELPEELVLLQDSCEVLRIAIDLKGTLRTPQEGVV